MLLEKGYYEIKYEKLRGIFYRIRNRVNGLGECSKQIMVPITLRRKSFMTLISKTSWDQEDYRTHSDKFLLAEHAR